jgi:hypothetical protein
MQGIPDLFTGCMAIRENSRGLGEREFPGVLTIETKA